MKTREQFAVFETEWVTRRDPSSRTLMQGSASVAWLALLVALCALVLLFWRPANLPFVDGNALLSAPTVGDATLAESSVQMNATTVSAESDQRSGTDPIMGQLSTRIAALEDVLPEVKSALEQETARSAEANAEREQLRRLVAQTIQDSVALTLLDVEPLLNQAQRLLANGSPIQAPISLLKAARDRAARAESSSLAPLIAALDQDREQLQVIAQRSVAKAADDLHRLALNVTNLRLLAPSGSVANVAPAAGTDRRAVEPGWLDRLAKSSSELIELPAVARSDDVVRVTEIGASDLGVLAPSARYFLTENLRSRLLSARLALLMHDRAGFDADRGRVLAWLNDHFDLSHAATQNALEVLQSLEPMGRPTVDISLAGSRAALKALAPGEPAR